MGIFIRVEVDRARCGPDGGRRLVGVCPVNIFVDVAHGVDVDPEMEDECTLCGLCLTICSEGAVRIRRLYVESEREASPK
jgi:NAD-dependent dihydropyrimidine dehydrogenase PreA subunit